MSPELKRGDRIRVRRPIRGYQAGDKGTILDGPTSYAGAGQKSYVVSMDKDGPGVTTIIFTVDEIELDQ